MSVRMKKHPTNEFIEIVVHNDAKTNSRYLLPRSYAQDILLILKPFEIAKHPDDVQSIPADEVFKNFYEKYGKIGATIRGFRQRDDLTQVTLAKKLAIHQTHVSQMEHGKRVIGKKMAQKLAKIFKTDYKLFL